MEPGNPQMSHTSTSRNFSRPFPSPLTVSSLSNSDKPSNDRNSFSRLPYSASVFDISRQFWGNEYLATNRSMHFTQRADSSETSTVAANRYHRQLKMIPPGKVACPHAQAGIVRSSSQYGQAAKLLSNSYGHCLRDGKHHPHFQSDKKTITDFSSTSWRTVPRDSRVLSLDLFRQVETSTVRAECTSDEDDEADEHGNRSVIIPLSALRPLLEFQQLVHLALTGMVSSYQSLIWRVVWLQPFLRTLDLSMALEPVFNTETDQPHRLIDGTWTLNNGYRNDSTISEYLGHHGEGILHEEFGDGEYLDSQAIKMARQQVRGCLPFNNERFLPVEKLSLERFVVDGGSVMRWFDPQRLRELEFKEGCVDAGLYLKPDMCHVKITAPIARPHHRHNYQHNHAGYHHDVGRAVKMGELKIVDLRRGRVVSRKDTHTGREELESAQQQQQPAPQPRLKVKMSQFMHGLTSKGKGGAS